MRLASARGLGSEAGLPGERASWPGTSPCAWAGVPGHSFPPCKAETPEAAAAQGPPWCLQRRGRLWALADAVASRGIRGAGRGEAHCRALRGGAASGRGRRRPRRDPAPPRFPTACHSLGLPSPRVLGPSAPSSSPGLIGRTLTLAADGAQSSSTPGRKRHTNRADRCISNSERSTLAPTIRHRAEPEPPRPEPDEHGDGLASSGVLGRAHGHRPPRCPGCFPLLGVGRTGALPRLCSPSPVSAGRPVRGQTAVCPPRVAGRPGCSGLEPRAPAVWVLAPPRCPGCGRQEGWKPRVTGLLPSEPAGTVGPRAPQQSARVLTASHRHRPAPSTPSTSAARCG